MSDGPNREYQDYREAFGNGPPADSPTPERRISVGLTAAGFGGRFELPEKHFAELLAWLAERSCGRDKKSNDGQ